MRAFTLVATLVLLAAPGCSAPASKGPCEGLVYTDSGLSREQYTPCAKAMVAKLDELWDDLAAIHEKDRSKAERLRACQQCLATCSALTRMWNQAGGSSKLVSMAWDDTDWNRFNYDVDASRTYYLSMCYYGSAVAMPSEMEAIHADARAFVAALR